MAEYTTTTNPDGSLEPYPLLPAAPVFDWEEFAGE
jgi:hypothetical protein